MTKRESILHAALELLTTNGIHATPMSAIAKAAGTGMGTIYNYFPNKEALINEIYLDIKLEESKVLVSQDNSLPVKTKFEEHYTNATSFFTSNPLFFKFMEQFQASPIITAQSKQIGKEAVSNVLVLMEQGKQERIIKDIPTHELMQFIGGTIISYLKINLQEDKESPKIVLKNQLTMVWDAIKA